MDAATNGATDHPMLIQVAMAQKINALSGGSVIAPWEVDLLPREWRSVIKGIYDSLPALKKVESDVEKILEQKRKEHPNYRK